VGAALEEAALGDPPVEGVENAPAGGGSRGVSTLAKTAVHTRTSVGPRATILTARYQFHTVLSGRVMLSHPTIQRT
jgi:hypothetical protein